MAIRMCFDLHKKFRTHFYEIVTDVVYGECLADRIKVFQHFIKVAKKRYDFSSCRYINGETERLLSQKITAIKTLAKEFRLLHLRYSNQDILRYF